MTLSHYITVMRGVGTKNRSWRDFFSPVWPVFSHANPFSKEILPDFSIFLHSQRISFRERGPTLCEV